MNNLKSNYSFTRRSARACALIGALTIASLAVDGGIASAAPVKKAAAPAKAATSGKKAAAPAKAATAGKKAAAPAKATTAGKKSVSKTGGAKNASAKSATAKKRSTMKPKAPVRRTATKRVKVSGAAFATTVNAAASRADVAKSLARKRAALRSNVLCGC